MHLLHAFFSGFVVAVISYLTVGPINMAIIQTTLNEGRRNGMLIGIGSAIADTIFCFVALFGFRFVAEHPTFLNIFHLVTIPILFLMGLKSIMHRDQPSIFKKKVRGRNFLFLGAVVCFSNPILLGYWFGVTTFLQDKAWLGTTTPDYVLFSMGVLSGIVSFIYLLVSVVAYTNRIIPQKWFSLINVIIGLTFIGFAIYLLIDYLFVHVFLHT